MEMKGWEKYVAIMFLIQQPPEIKDKFKGQRFKVKGGKAESKGREGRGLSAKQQGIGYKVQD